MELNPIFCEGVAKYMMKNAEKYGLDEDYMFSLGYLHRFGTQMVENNYAATGSTVLFRLGYKYSNIISWCNTPPYEYCKCNLVDEPPIELILLWQGISHTAEDGSYVSYEEKLEMLKDAPYTMRQKDIFRFIIEFLQKWEEYKEGNK